MIHHTTSSCPNIVIQGVDIDALNAQSPGGGGMTELFKPPGRVTGALGKEKKIKPTRGGGGGFGLSKS
jgi:hypothetical protein